MNIITIALHVADAAVAFAKVSTTRADDIKMYDEALTVIREARAEQDHIAASGKPIAELLQTLHGGGAFPFVEVGYVGEFVSPSESLPAGTPLCVGPVQPMQEHSEQYWLHEINNARAEGYEKGRASCKHDERMLELGVPVQPVKQEPVGYAAQSVIDWLVSDERTDAAYSGINLYKNPTGNSTIPLYAAQVSAKREWVDLTDDEIYHALAEVRFVRDNLLDGCRAVIAADREKNRG